jgi:hypothetical protein
VDLLAGQQIGFAQQIAVDGDASLVVQLGCRERGPMYLAFQHYPLHDGLSRSHLQYSSIIAAGACSARAPIL